LTRELAEDGYSGVEVRGTPMRTEIIIRATRTQNVLGKALIFYFSFFFLNYLVIFDMSVSAVALAIYSLKIVFT
jgi:hypothetical protein